MGSSFGSEKWSTLAVLLLGISLAGCAGEDGATSDVDPAEVTEVTDEASENADVTDEEVAEAGDDGEEEKKPKLVTIDDITHLQPVVFNETSVGLEVTPEEGEPKGRLAFVLPDGVSADNYRNFGQFIAGEGWRVHIIDNEKNMSVLNTEHTKDECTIIGSIGDKSYEVMKYGYVRRESVDGAILVGFLKQSEEIYKKKLPIVLIAGGKDNIAPYSTISKQYPEYPAQTYLLTINEANHGGYYDGQTFEGDGEARVPASQQRLILGEVVSNMIDRLCLSRETRYADEARKAAREAAKAAAEVNGTVEDAITEAAEDVDEAVDDASEGGE
ncbi:MAG: alpha/beta hydrolase [Pseudomonadota bacterium]